MRLTNKKNGIQTELNMGPLNIDEYELDSHAFSEISAQWLDYNINNKKQFDINTDFYCKIYQLWFYMIISQSFGGCKMKKYLIAFTKMKNLVTFSTSFQNWVAHTQVIVTAFSGSFPKGTFTI